MAEDLQVTLNAAAVNPVAQFTASPRAGPQPLTVTFTDLSTNTPTSWKWEYMKPGSEGWVQFSTVKDPIFTFPLHGVYSIRLTVTNGAGANTLIKFDYITVNFPPVPVPAFTATPRSGVSPVTVQFTDQSTNNPDLWKWEFKRSGSRAWTLFSTAKNPSFTFVTPGTYSIQFTAANIGGRASVVKTSYITITAPPAPIAAFTATPTSGLVPLTVQFIDQSTNTPTRWKWEYLKSGTDRWYVLSTSQNPSFKFSQTGTYSIRLTAINDQGRSTSTKSNFIQVLA